MVSEQLPLISIPIDIGRYPKSYINRRIDVHPLPTILVKLR